MGILNLETDMKEEAAENLQSALVYFKKMRANFMVEKVKELLSVIS